jgi:hypothetical protein
MSKTQDFNGFKSFPLTYKDDFKEKVINPLKFKHHLNISAIVRDYLTALLNELEEVKK